MAYKKTVEEKLETKLNSLNQYDQIQRIGNLFQIDDELFLEITADALVYGRFRFHPQNIDPVHEDNYSVTIRLSHENLKYLNSNPINPPKGARNVYNIFRRIQGLEINRIVIGVPENSLEAGILGVTGVMYDYIQQISREEGIEKDIKVFNRTVPFLVNQFGIDIQGLVVDRNYGLLLQEIIESGQFSQADLISLTENLEEGESANVVIERQVLKQVEWLIDEIELILEEDRLTVPAAKRIGYESFGYAKVSVRGPEHLMEKILTDYGQYSLLGVPALLNTGKYVIHDGVARCQFDLILINHLGDIELVELKRPDQYLFEFGDGRGKFYPSKDLAIAISQLERYITAVYKDNDEEYLIGGLKIRDFINGEVGNELYVESIRPKGLIIIGSWQKLCKPYEQLSVAQRAKITKENYRDDSMQAYKELKHSLKNISIMTYSELLETARTRLQLADDE